MGMLGPREPLKVKRATMALLKHKVLASFNDAVGAADDENLPPQAPIPTDPKLLPTVGEVALLGDMIKTRHLADSVRAAEGNELQPNLSEGDSTKVDTDSSEDSQLPADNWLEAA